MLHGWPECNRLVHDQNLTELLIESENVAESWWLFVPILLVANNRRCPPSVPSSEHNTRFDTGQKWARQFTVDLVPLVAHERRFHLATFVLTCFERTEDPASC